MNIMSSRPQGVLGILRALASASYKYKYKRGVISHMLYAGGLSPMGLSPAKQRTEDKKHMGLGRGQDMGLNPRGLGPKTT